MEQHISVERALELISASIRPLPGVELPARAAEGLVLAEAVTAPMDQPPWPRSPLDGYALRAKESEGASPAHPISFRVAATVYAGDVFFGPLEPGACVRIMTGAPIPEDCDCVLRWEDTDNGTETVRIHKSLRPYENYCHAGEDFRVGTVLLSAGTRLDPMAMGLLASAGLLREHVRLKLRPRLRCALLCTGDELAPADGPLGAGQIYSSNAWSLGARLRELGVEVTSLRERCSDEAESLAAALGEAAEGADLVITTGGVSAGDRDVLPDALTLLGAEPLFHHVHLKPGSPLMLSRYREKPILSLSGNPFAAAATFELFARPILARLLDCSALLPLPTTGRLTADFPKTAPVPRYIRCAYEHGWIRFPEGHSSGQLASALGSNALALLPAEQMMCAGREVEVLLL